MKKLCAVIFTILALVGCSTKKEIEDSKHITSSKVEEDVSINWNIEDYLDNVLISDYYNLQFGRHIDNFKEYELNNELKMIFLYRPEDKSYNETVKLYFSTMRRNQSEVMPEYSKPIKIELPYEQFLKLKDSTDKYADKYLTEINDTRFEFLFVNYYINTNVSRDTSGYKEDYTYKGIPFIQYVDQLEWYNPNKQGFDNNWIREDSYYREKLTKMYNTDLDNPFYNYFNLNERIKVGEQEYQVLNINEFRYKNRILTLEEFANLTKLERLIDAYNDLKNNNEFINWKKEVYNGYQGYEKGQPYDPNAEEGKAYLEQLKREKEEKEKRIDKWLNDKQEETDETNKKD